MPPAVASLGDIEPALARALAREGAADIGHLRILELLRIGAGVRPFWVEDAIAVVVVSGLLVSDDDGAIAGPGDVITDAPAGWAACTAAELAVAGPAFVAAVRSRPGAAAALAGLARRWPAEPSAGGTLDDRVLHVLWRLASQWGTARGSGMTLALPVEAGGLACLTRADEDDVARALTALIDGGAVARRAGGGWELAGGSGIRGEHLRARAAQQVAAARQAVSDHAALSHTLTQELRRSTSRRSR